MPKKKGTLTSPFVSAEEQPYPIPENWCWVKLGSLLSEIRNGTTIKQDKSGFGYYVTRIESLQNQTIDFNRLGNIVNEEEIKDTDWYIDGDIALSHINSADHVGKTALIKPDMLPLVHGMNLLRLRFYKTCIPTFFQYYSQSFQYKDEILARINMAVNQVSINQKQLGTLEFPLPPLPEQHRIVTCIESLFAKLDEAREKAQAVVEGFELRKSAVLHKAFTGELTERWRKEHGVGLDSWETKTSKELFDYVTSGSRGWAQYYSETGAVFVRMGNLDHGTIELDFSDVQHVRLPDKAEGQRSRLQKNDILISITADVGMIGLVREMNFEAYINQHIALVRPNDENDSEFLAWYLVSDVGLRQMQGKQRGATKVGLGLDDIRSLRLSMPKIEEQKEIVAILNELMNKEEQAKSAAEAVLSQIDTMKKAILARAFRGELGTNDPAEESAAELLNTILGE